MLQDQIIEELSHLSIDATEIESLIQITIDACKHNEQYQQVIILDLIQQKLKSLCNKIDSIDTEVSKTTLTH